MHLDEVLSGLVPLARDGSTVEISGVQYDSRRVSGGDLFVAMQGGTTDGNLYIDKAIAQGAAAIVTDSAEAFAALRVRTPGLAVALVAQGRRALAEIAANVLGHPERVLAVSAVTGTNGKTTTAWLLEQLLRSVGRKCVLLGTIETHVGDEVRSSEHTTPEASDLLRLFADGVQVGATEAVMEMSSHALDQERVWGVPVDVAMFTNLTQDHLDYHGTMDAYLAAKAKLFAGSGTKPPREAVLNADDGASAKLLTFCTHSEVMRYGLDESAAYRGLDVSFRAGRTRFVFETPARSVAFDSPLSGQVNVANLLAASCAALARGLTLEEIASAVPHLRQVPGRFETVPNDAGLTVVVDYAHTDDALRNLIKLARHLAGSARVITLFGCGGDRDRSKRPKMGRAAGEGSDLVIVTSDNPRTEEPSAILEQALVGVRQTAARFLVEPDRATAIALAIHEARRGDIVLLAGKGHEKVQILKTGTIAFDDVAVASGILKGLQ